MLYRLIAKLDSKVHFTTVAAHGENSATIFDPFSAQITVLNIIQLVDLLDDLQRESSLVQEQQAQFDQLVAQKALQTDKVEEEILVIWHGYIKLPQLEQFPELHRLIHNIMMDISRVKRGINRKTSLSLLNKVNRFAEIFWQSKDQMTFMAKCPYPPEQSLVYPALN